MKRLIILIALLAITAPVAAQEPPPPPAEMEPAPEPTLSERVATVHAALMQAVTAYESGEGAEDAADHRVNMARDELSAAEAGRQQVVNARAEIRQSLITHLQNVMAAAEALIAELSF